MVVHAYYPLGEVRVEREAAALIQDGFEVDVICLREGDEPLEEQIDGIHIFRQPVKRHRGKGQFLQLMEYLAFFTLAFLKLTSLHLKNRYSSVQVHNLPDFLVFCAIVPKLTGTPVLLDLHDLMPEFFAAQQESGMDSLAVSLLKLQERVSCAFADRVITVTELWKNTLIQRGVPAEKISVVMNVADPNVFVRSADSRKRSSPNGSFKLIYHGTITHRYGADLLLQAVHTLRGEIPGLHVTVHGRGEFLDELEQIARDLELGDAVHFSTEYLPTQELPRMILDSDLGIVPYRSNIFTDGILPTKLMEYVALGIPVVASRTPAIEAYFDDSMVQYFPAGEVESLVDCIRHLYNDRSRLNELAENAERFNERYNWPVIAADYVATVRSLINKR